MTVLCLQIDSPFSISSGIVALTALDYLGFGLRPPTPSWGELLQQGWTNLSDYWIAGSVIIAMVITFCVGNISIIVSIIPIITPQMITIL